MADRIIGSYGNLTLRNLNLVGGFMDTDNNKIKRVSVEKYDPDWIYDFEKIKREIELELGEIIVSIEHVGSTSVEGMCAKPCIDIDVVIKDYTVFDVVINGLSNIGYIYEGELGIKDRHAFDYHNKPHLKTHHLYVCPQCSKELHRHITFRDYLRSHPEAVELYSQVKLKAAELYPNDINKYIEYKSPCIEKLYKDCGLI